MVVERSAPPKSGFGFYARLAGNLLSPLPYSVASHQSDALGKTVKDYATKNQVDLWQAEWTPYAESLQVLGDVRRLIMAHNVESQIWRRYYETEANPLRRWYIGRQWQKYEAFERRVFQQVDRVVAVSAEDSVLIRNHFGVGHVDVVENGVDTNYFQPGSSQRVPGQILFLGSLDWRPNLDAVEQLLSRVFPAVLAQEPSARLCLVGRSPPEFLRRRLAATPGVELYADVKDVRPFLAQAALMVVPLRIGGGSRLKILEAFASGLPVISTKVGAEGLDASHGTHLTAVDTVENMTTAILENLRNSRLASSVVGRARRLVEDRYDWEILADRLGTIWVDAAGHTMNFPLRRDEKRVEQPTAQ